MALSMSLAQHGTPSLGVVSPVWGFLYSLDLLASVCNSFAHKKCFMNPKSFVPKVKLHPNGGPGNLSDVSFYSYLAYFSVLIRLPAIVAASLYD